jgi:hypothetical protein
VTPFSPRYAAAIAGAVGLLLAPAVVRSTLVVERSECSDVAAFLEPARFDPRSRLVTDGDRPSELENGRLVAIVEDPAGNYLLTYSVVRLRGLQSNLLQPPDALPGTPEPDRLEPRLLDTGEGVIPVTYAFERRETRARTTAYFLAYDGRAVANPFWTRVRATFESLVDGPLPITLFVASTHVHQSRQAEAEARLDDWLRNAWRVYRSDCVGRKPPPIASSRGRGSE